MIETLFSPPYNVSESEYREIRTFSPSTIGEVVQQEQSRPHDIRWTAIYDLYHLRRDEEGMAHALDQIQDREWAAEMTYRDVYTTEELERMANNSAARERDGPP